LYVQVHYNIIQKVVSMKSPFLVPVVLRAALDGRDGHGSFGSSSCAGPEFFSPTTISRRAVLHRALASSLATAAAGAFPSAALAAPSSPSPTAASSAPETIRIPLQYVPSLSAYVVSYSVAGDRFRAILDTGSPFLMVPSFCSQQRWGCYRGPESSLPSGLSPTLERFDNNEGLVEWRNAPFAFENASGSMIGPTAFTFGVLSESLLSGPGGVFFGLVRDTDPWIRPSFLGQTPVKSFQIDLASEEEGKSLTLTSSDATSSLVSDSLDFIPLTRDLNRRFGDPTIHYTTKAQTLVANGYPLATTQDGKPTYVIFDTGVSGMVISRELLDERYMTARKNRERNLWGQVEIRLKTKRGKPLSLKAQKPVVTPLGEKPWPSFNAHLIVVGLAFLDGHKITVDIDRQKLWIEDRQST